jgi:hypothetical protein
MMDVLFLILLEISLLDPLLKNSSSLFCFLLEATYVCPHFWAAFFCALFLEVDSIYWKNQRNEPAGGAQNMAPFKGGKKQKSLALNPMD